MTCHSILNTTRLGDLLLVADESHLIGLYFLDRAHAPAPSSCGVRAPEHRIVRQAVDELQEYLAGARTAFSLPLGWRGTPFQKRVWQEISRIPHGETITYTELARRSGAAPAIRAAGTATGRNPLSIVVPCHRVVGKNGSLAGYAGGLPRKQFLLGWEQGIITDTGTGGASMVRRAGELSRRAAVSGQNTVGVN